MDAAEPAGRHPPDPRRLRDRERAADGGGADRALHLGRRQVARADLPRVRAEPCELRLRQTDDDLAVEDADRRRHGAAGAHLPLRLETDLDALARREAVRDERRLQRDDRAARGERRANLLRDPHGSEPTVRDAARRRLEPAAGRILERAAEQEPGRERVAGAGRVDDLRLDGREVEPRVLRDDGAAARAALDHADRRREVRAAEHLPLGLGREQHVGRDRVEQLPEPHRPVRADLCPRGDVDGDARAALAREPRRQLRRGADRLPQQRVAGDVQDVAVDPRGIELVRREARRDAAVRRHRPVAVGADDGDDDAGRAGSDRSDELDTVRRELSRDELGRRVVAALRDAARVRSERRRPGCDVRRLAARAGARARPHVVARGERLLEPHDHVEHQVADGCDPHSRNRPTSADSPTVRCGYRSPARLCPRPARWGRRAVWGFERDASRSAVSRRRRTSSSSRGSNSSYQIPTAPSSSSSFGQ